MHRATQGGHGRVRLRPQPKDGACSVFKVVLVVWREEGRQSVIKLRQQSVQER